MEPLESRRLLTATVFITQTDPATEGYTAGSLTAYRGEFHVWAFIPRNESAPTPSELTIPYQVSGTANKPGGTGPADHTLTDGTLTVHPNAYPYYGEGFIDFGVLRDNLVEGDETVKVTLQPGTGYTIADPGDAWPSVDGTDSLNIGPDPAVATTTIKDDPPVVRVDTLDPTAAEPYGTSGPADTGTFNVGRTGGDLTVPLTVDLEVNGTATPPPGAGRDYNFSGNLILGGTSAAPMAASASSAGPVRDPIRPPNRNPFGTPAHLTLPAVPNGTALSEANVVVTPVADDHVESTETVTLAALASPHNTAPGPVAAPINIAQGPLIIRVNGKDPGWDPATDTLTITRPQQGTIAPEVLLAAFSGGKAQFGLTFQAEFITKPQPPLPGNLVEPSPNVLQPDDQGHNPLAIQVTANTTTQGTYTLQIWSAFDKSDAVTITVIVI